MPASETIPEDVRKAAIAALDAQRNASGWSFMSTFDERIEVLSRAILAERARATAAERERCARVAERVGKKLAEPAIGHAIAVEILAGDHNAS